MRPYIKSRSDIKTPTETVAGELQQARSPPIAHELAYLPTALSALRDTIADDDVLDVRGVVKLLHVGRNKLYEMVARNQIPHRRFGRCIRFSRAAIMRWLDSCWLQDAKERQ